MYTKMEQDLFKFLPSEIITNILLRLPVRTIANCKCVCKSWLDLLKTDEFVKSHLSRSAAGLAFLMMERNPSRCTVFELEDEIDLESSDDHHYKHLTKFDFPYRVAVEGSANGLLFLSKNEPDFNALYVCNPISREYIELHCPEGFFIPQRDIYGFGASRITCLYKVVRIVHNSDCHVYTLGTGSWRCVEAPSASFEYGSCTSGAFVNGNLHWLVLDSNDTAWISCFDLETECFSTFVVPPLQGRMDCIEGLYALRDCLCFCDHSSEDDIIVIWLMKEYGVEKSWTKEYVIRVNPGCEGEMFVFVYPIKVFKDGILMVWDEQLISYYSNKTKTIQEIDAFHGCLESMFLTPSFMSLKSFQMENVFSL